MDKLFEIVSHMAPEDALSEVTNVLSRLLQDLDGEAVQDHLVLTLQVAAGF